MKNLALENSPEEVKLTFLQKLIKKIANAFGPGSLSKPVTGHSRIMRQRIAHRIISCLAVKKKLDRHDASFKGPHKQISDLPGCRI